MTARTRRVAIGTWVAAAVVASAAGGYLLYRTTQPAAAAPGVASVLQGDTVWPGAGRPAPAVALTDQFGNRFTLASQRGRVVIVTFLDSHCREMCPIEGQELRAVDNRLRPSQRPVIVVVSVNPADTRSSVRRFVSTAGWHAPWYWLMGSRRQLAPIWRQFGIQVIVQAGDNSIGHSTAIYLLSRSGRERAGDAAPFLPDQVAADVRLLERAA